MKSQKTPKVEIVQARPAIKNPVAVFLASLPSPVSRLSQLSALNVIARRLGAPDAYSFDWTRLTYAEMTIIQTWLAEEYKPRTVRRYVAAVKGVLRTSWRMNLLSADEYMRATAIKAPRGETLSGRMLMPEEVAALLQTCRTGPRIRGIRDQAIIALLVGCGLRRAEITTLTIDDYHAEEGKLLVHGKGRKERWAYPQGGVRDALSQWLQERGHQPGPLFLVIVKEDTILQRKMTAENVWKMLKLRNEIAGIRKFAPHDLRRTFISNLLDQPGVDMVTASRLAGHSDPGRTARYDRRSERTAERAAATIEVPFTARGEL